MRYHDQDTGFLYLRVVSPSYTGAGGQAFAMDWMYARSGLWRIMGDNWHEIRVNVTCPIGFRETHPSPHLSYNPEAPDIEICRTAPIESPPRWSVDSSARRVVAIAEAGAGAGANAAVAAGAAAGDMTCSGATCERGSRRLSGSLPLTAADFPQGWLEM